MSERHALKRRPRAHRRGDSRNAHEETFARSTKRDACEGTSASSSWRLYREAPAERRSRAHQKETSGREVRELAKTRRLRKTPEARLREVSARRRRRREPACGQTFVSSPWRDAREETSGAHQRDTLAKRWREPAEERRLQRDVRCELVQKRRDKRLRRDFLEHNEEGRLWRGVSESSKRDACERRL